MATYLPTGMIPGLLSPEQEAAVKQDAIRNAALNFGLQALASSSGIGYKPTVGQIIGQAGQSGLQAYQGTFDQQLQNMLRQQQMADLQRKRKAEEDRQAQLAKLVESAPESQRGLVSLFPEKYAETQFTVPKPPEYSEMFKNAAITLFGHLGPFTADERKQIEKKANEYRIAPPVAAATATAAANLRDPIRLQESARQIQRDFSKDIDPDYQVADRFNIIADNIKNPTPIGDTAIIYSLAKIINPGEAIMEGDIRNILSNRSIPDSVKQAAQKAVSGENLTENERLEIQSVAWTIVQERKGRLDRKTSQTAKQLENLKQSPADYITNPYDRVSSPDQLVVNFKGKKTVARKAEDGQYYVQEGSKFYKVVR